MVKALAWSCAKPAPNRHGRQLGARPVHEVSWPSPELLVFATSAVEEPVSKTERASRLKQVPFLAQLSESALERIARICAWREFSEGAQILDYQDDTTDVYFLIQGKVRIIIYSH